uniref:F-box domain-containing protein n=1 Tax=Echeneis naucrates TaxID=173247 RepID=A0A665XCM2_ECHNA
MDEDNSDLSDEECWYCGNSERGKDWGLLPDVCLRHIFWCLPDCDRINADMVCRHWHSVMRSPSLWRCRFFHFSGRLSKFRQSEYCCAVTYARYLGVYLERLEVCVSPPRRSLTGQRLQQTISGLFSELTRVRAPLRSLSLVRLDLDRPAWTLVLRNSLVNSVIDFLCKGSSKLTSVCLNGMRINIQQGLELLSALSQAQRHSYICSLDLVGFFSSGLVYSNSTIPSLLCHFHGLTNLSLSYSCLSDELLMALCPSPLQNFSLYCQLNESHQQVLCGESWAALASSCPDLKVKLTVDQVINTDRLARILQRQIPLIEYCMTAFYSPDEDWSAKTVLCHLLPQYRRSLQYLALDLSNCNESLDEELLGLAKVCERLEQLRIWAFLEIGTVKELLNIRLRQRSLLNKIRVRKTNITG